MADPKIRIRRSAVPGKIPDSSQLDLGELAINTYDGKVFIEQDQSSIGIGTTVIVVNPWSVGPGTNTYNTYFTSGNVGIGTTNPQEKLDLVGNLKISGGINVGGTTGSSGQVLKSTGTGLEWGTDNTGGGSGDNYWIKTTAGIHTLSNVGIGTTNPQVKLQIDGVLGFGTFTNPYTSTLSSTNIRIGDTSTGANLTSGYDNIFMGIGAGNSSTSGSYNNFFGPFAGFYNTSGFYNNFIGYYAGYNNTGGNDNNFFGRSAGRFNTSGSNNNFLGDYAGNSNVSGSYNNFFGYESGYSNTIGTFNNFLGRASGINNTTGNYNIFLGSYSGISTSASYNIIFGSGNPSGLFDAPDTTKDTQFAVGIRTDSNPSKYWLVGNENFNIGIGTTNPTSKLTVGGDISNAHTSYGSSTSSASTLSPIGIHSTFPITTYRSVEYFIQATTGTRYQATKILSIHDGSTAYNTTYGDIFSNGLIATFDVDISGGNIRLVSTASTTSNVNYIINYVANKV